MPQLDIYTYFTQFQWLLVIFTLLFLLINGQFVPTFQSLFEARDALRTTPESKDAIEGSGLKPFEYEKNKSTTMPKPSSSSQLIVSKWDQIYDKFAKHTIKEQVVSEISKSNSKGTGSGKKGKPKSGKPK